MHFTLNDILQNFDSGTYGRGRAYAQRGMVRALAPARDASCIDSKVSGSGGQVYRQSIGVVNRRNGIQFDGECSCPMQFNCKHVVAVLLSWLDQMPGAGSSNRTADAPGAVGGLVFG